MWLALLLIVGIVAWLIARAYKAGKTSEQSEESKRDLEAAKAIIESETDSPKSLSDLRNELRNKGRKL